MARPIIAAPKQSDVIIDRNGQPTEVLRRCLELMAYRLNKIDEAATNYDALDTGSASAGDVAAALNELIETVTET